MRHALAPKALRTPISRERRPATQRGHAEQSGGRDHERHERERALNT
jgi:hypothetical protein